MDVCVCCGEYAPEGSMICANCQVKAFKAQEDTKESDVEKTQCSER